jgi:hypothetical protein
MFFGLTNSPATFQAMMNSIYQQAITKHESRGTNIHIYMDDIAVATKTTSLQGHVEAVSDVLQVAKDHSLFFKLSKCSFHTPSIDYLGLVLERGLTKMDPVKLAGIRNWPTPKDSQRRSILPWILQLLSFIHPWILQDHTTLECADEERSRIPMDGGHPKGLQHSQGQDDRSTCTSTS